MARPRREWDAKMFDHIVMRGNNRQNIFRNDADIAEFFRILHYVYEKYPFIIVAFCIMTNHYHLLIRSPEVPPGKIMAILNRRYTDYYKKKYRYSGFLYDSRYFAKMMTSTNDLLVVSRYIHRNPIETKVPMVDRLERYKYSSYPYYYTSTESPYPFLNLDLLPSLLPPSYEKTAQGYCAYCEAEEVDLKVDELGKPGVANGANIRLNEQ